MGKLDTQSTVTLILNGEQTKTSLKEVTSAVNEYRAELNKMRQDDNPALYEERRQALAKLIDTQKQMRAEIMNSTEAQKGFFSDFKKGFEEIESIAKGVTIGTLISSMVRGGIEAVSEFFGSAQKEFEEAERTQAQLQAVLTSTGGAAGVTKKQLEDYQKTLMNQTGVDDDVIAKGEEMLLTFTNIHGKVYEQALPAIVDLTAAMNGGQVSMEGIQQISIQVGKALNDPINGMTSLRKIGVTFNDQQKQQIKTMQESGNMMGAQTVILQELNKEFGGTATTIRESAVGALQAFNTDLGNLKETVGGWMVSFKGALAGLFDPLIKSMADTRTAGEQLADSFKEQAQQIDSLQKNTIPLLNRYDELKEKSSLNKTEQGELKTIISQIADTIPSAVTQWNKYGNAIDISTGKARDFINVQRALMEFTNKDAISKLVAERNDITEQRNDLTRQLNNGKVVETTQVPGGAGMTSNTITTTRDMTDAEIQQIRTKLKDLTNDTKKIDDTIKGLTGSYLDDLDKKTEAGSTAIKKLSEMTVGELQKRIQQLNDSLKDTVIGSDAYKKIIQEINDTEKLLDQTKSDKNESKTQQAAERKAQQYSQQLDQVRSQYLQLAEAAKKGTVEDLDAQLAVIDKKFKTLVDKLKKLAADTKDQALKKELLGDVSDITKAGGLEDQDKDAATKADKDKKTANAKKQAAQDQKTSKGFTNGVESLINQGFADQKSALDDQQAQEIALATSEASQVAIKEKYRQLDLQLEKKHLDTLKSWRVANGQQTKDLDKQIGKNSIDIASNTAAQKERIQQEEYALAKTITNGLGDLIQITMGNSALGVALQKTVAIAQIAIDTAQAISAAVKTGSMVGLTPIEKAIAIAGNIAVVLANIVKAKQELSSASDVKAPQVKKAAKGAVFAGPSHDQGGIDLVNTQTGQTIGNMEGGEPIMVLSRDTYANNRRLVNELLYNSQYRNGAPIRVNSEMAMKATGNYLATGGVISAGSKSATTSGKGSGASAGMDLSPVIDAINTLGDRINDIEVVFNDTAYTEFKRKQAVIINKAKNK